MSMFHELMMKKKGMPSNYQEVEYIESTGTQYILTDVVPNNETGVSIDVMSIISSDRVIVGCRNSGTESRFFVGSTDKYYFGWNTYSSLDVSSVNNKVNITLNYKNDRQASINRNLFKTLTTYNGTNYHIMIFGANISGTPTYLATARIYNLQISQGNSVIRNYIPVYDTLTNKYGMWESVQGKFYGNDGTGDFKGSIVGYTVVGSPTITDGVVSGFSNANYLNIQDGSSFDFNNNFEFKVEFVVNTVSNAPLLTGSSAYYGGLQINNSKIRFACRKSDNTTYSFLSAKNIVTNSHYIAICSRKENILTLKIYKDGVLDETLNDNLENISFIESEINTIRIGYSSIETLDGSVYLNNTTITKNNKLWFNGQPA